MSSLELAVVVSVSIAAFAWAAFIGVRSISRGPEWAVLAYGSSQWIWVLFVIGASLSGSLAIFLGVGYISLVSLVMARRTRRGLLATLAMGTFDSPGLAYRLSVLGVASTRYLASGFGVVGLGLWFDTAADGLLEVALGLGGLMVLMAVSLRVERRRQEKMA